MFSGIIFQFRLFARSTVYDSGNVQIHNTFLKTQILKHEENWNPVWKRTFFPDGFY